MSLKTWFRSTGVWLAGIFLAAVLAFAPALDNTMILDDHALVKKIEVPDGPAEWARAAIAPWWPPAMKKNLWRPVTRLSILAEKAALGPEPWHFYGVNILLHGAVCLLLFLLARRLGWSAPAAGLGALLFAVHPLHAEAVHQVVGRAELLAAFWMLSGLLLYLRYGARGGRGLLLQAGCFALALGSKEHALVYPCLLVLLSLDYSSDNAGNLEERNGTAPLCRVQRSPASARSALDCGSVLPLLNRHGALDVSYPAGQSSNLNPLRARLPALPWCLLALLFVILGLFFAGKAAITGGVLEPPSSVPYVENPLASMGLVRRLPAVLGIFGFVASRLVWPVGLSPDYAAYSLPFECGWSWGWTWAGLTALILIGALSVRNARRGGRGWLLAAAALGSYTLISNGPYTIGTVMAERLWYWPSAPACLGLGWLLAGLYGRLEPARRRLGEMALAAVLLALAVLAWGNGLAWRSLENHAVATLARFPGSWRGHTDYAAVCSFAHKYEEGYAHAREAVRMMPRLAYGWGWLGANAMYLPGYQAEAGQAFATAMTLDPTLSIFDQYWGLLLRMEGREEEAARHGAG